MATKKSATRKNATKSITVKKTATPAKKATVVRATKKDNGPLNVEKVSRTELVKKINNTRGNVFVSTHVDGKNNLRTMTCVRNRNGATQLGYINVYSIEDEGFRSINTRTVVSAVIGKTLYKGPIVKVTA